MNFKFRLQELIHQKRILINSYLYNLIIKSIIEGDLFILKCLFNFFISKENWHRMKDS